MNIKTWRWFFKDADTKCFGKLWFFCTSIFSTKCFHHFLNLRYLEFKCMYFLVNHFALVSRFKCFFIKDSDSLSGCMIFSWSEKNHVCSSVSSTFSPYGSHLKSYYFYNPMVTCKHWLSNVLIKKGRFG